MPSRSSSVHSSAHTSPCPSPTPSFSRQRSRDEPATPLRSNSDGRRPSSGDERTRSRDDLRSPGARSPSNHEWSRSPQLSLLSSNSVSQRGSREVLGDLKELTFGSKCSLCVEFFFANDLPVEISNFKILRFLTVLLLECLFN